MSLKINITKDKYIVISVCDKVQLLILWKNNVLKLLQGHVWCWKYISCQNAKSEITLDKQEQM